ncbi:hypothetical protein N0V85_001798 [Neurospora sp. IMI 360204]|nr:hypothetical protein N0V85_001798 [Neurospora sp. IMI 360204]
MSPKAPNGVEGLKPGSHSPHRQRHQITRSITELPSSLHLHRHRSSRDRHGKEKEKDKEKHKDKNKARDREREREKGKDRDGLNLDIQSAITTLQSTARGRFSFEGFGMSTPNNQTPNASRRASILNASPSADDSVPSVATAVLTNTIPGGRVLLKEDEIAEERQKAIARENGLKKSLEDLEQFSNNTTRQLDDTYYSVLEKLCVLQSTILALREVAVASQDMTSHFTTEADELVTDVSSQLDAFGQFEDHQKRIEQLQDRVYVGRDRIKSLSERVDLVRERIESWERADREWQERTRRRLKAFWVLTSGVIFLVLLIFVGSQFAPENSAATVEGAVMAASKLANDSLNTLKNVTLVGTGELLGQGPRLKDTGGEHRQEKGNDEQEMDSPGGSATVVAEASDGETSSAWISPATLAADKLRAFDEL